MSLVCPLQETTEAPEQITSPTLGITLLPHQSEPHLSAGVGAGQLSRHQMVGSEEFPSESTERERSPNVESRQTFDLLVADSAPESPSSSQVSSPPLDGFSGATVVDRGATPMAVVPLSDLSHGGFVHSLQGPPRPVPDCASDRLTSVRFGGFQGAGFGAEPTLERRGVELWEEPVLAGGTRDGLWTLESVEMDSASSPGTGVSSDMSSTTGQSTGPPSASQMFLSSAPLITDSETPSDNATGQVDDRAQFDESRSHLANHRIISEHTPQSPATAEATPFPPPTSRQTSSLGSSSDDQTTTSTQSRIQRFVSSPQFSVSSTNSATTTPFPSLLHPCTPHGSYHVVNAQENPFAVQFLAAVEENMTKLKAQGSEDATQKGLRHSSASTTSSSSKGHELPPKALQDQGFVEYVAMLGRKPKRSDYISYKIALIGDRIDQKYDQQLNQAFEDVFSEVWKSSISWDSFSVAARRLLWQGKKVQDGIFMIPCFGRRITECFPDMKDRITRYTRQVLETYAGNWILEYGGLVSSGCISIDAPPV